MLSEITNYIADAITQMMRGMINMLNSLYGKLLSAILRSSFAIMLVMHLFMANAMPSLFELHLCLIGSIIIGKDNNPRETRDFRLKYNYIDFMKAL